MAHNALFLGVSQVVTTALTIVLNAAVARTLGAADYGSLYLLTSIATFVYVFVDWGHGPYLIREIARDPRRAGNLLGSALVVRALAMLLMCALAVSGTWILGYDARTCALTATIIVAWFPVYTGLAYSWVFRARERMDYDAISSITLKAATLAITFASLALGGHVVGWILSAGLAGSVTLLLAVFLYRRLELPVLRPTKATAIELLRDGAPILTMTLAIAVQPYIDANILFASVPREVVGWYGAAWNIAGTLIAPAGVVAATVYPRLSRATHHPAELSRVLQASLRPLVLIAALAAVGTFLFADVGVGLVYGRAKFGPSAQVLRVFALVLPLIYVDMLLGHVIVALGKASGMATAKLIGVVLTTSIELIAVPWCQVHYQNGGIGLMVAMATGEIVVISGAFWMIPRSSRGPASVDVLRAVIAALITLGAMRALPLMPPWCGIPVCILLFVAAASITGLLRRDDIQLLTGSFGRRRAASAV